MDTVGQLGKEIPSGDALGSAADRERLLAKRAAELLALEEETKRRRAELEKEAAEGEVVTFH